MHKSREKRKNIKRSLRINVSTVLLTRKLYPAYPLTFLPFASSHRFLWEPCGTFEENPCCKNLERAFNIP